MFCTNFEANSLQKLALSTYDSPLDNLAGWRKYAKGIKVALISIVSLGLLYAYSLYLRGKANPWQKVSYFDDFSIGKNGNFTSQQKTNYFHFQNFQKALEKGSHEAVLKSAILLQTHRQLYPQLSLSWIKFGEIAYKGSGFFKALSLSKNRRLGTLDIDSYSETLLRYASEPNNKFYKNWNKSTNRKATHSLGCLKMMKYLVTGVTDELKAAKVEFEKSRQLGHSNANHALQVVQTHMDTASYKIKRIIKVSLLALTSVMALHRQVVLASLFSSPVTSILCIHFAYQATKRTFENIVVLSHQSNNRIKKFFNIMLPIFIVGSLFYSAGRAQDFITTQGVIQQALQLSNFVVNDFFNRMSLAKVGHLTSALVGGSFSYFRQNNSMQTSLLISSASFMLSRIAQFVIANPTTSVVNKVSQFVIPLFIGIRAYRSHGISLHETLSGIAMSSISISQQLFHAFVLRGDNFLKKYLYNECGVFEFCSRRFGLQG